jgi:DNA polymerase elongation subunit (family B)
MVGFFDKPVLVLDFASLYPTIIRAHNLCYSSIVLSKEFLNLPNYDYYKVEYHDNDTNSTKTHYFVQNNESILPDLLKNLMEQRTNVRKEMKDPNLDPFKKMVLNGFQLALKVSANSIYGFLAAQTLQCTPISACTTAIGRNMIKNTKEFVNENYKDFETIYGDSVTKDTLITIKNEFGNLKTQEIKDLCNKWEDYSQFKGNTEGVSLKQQNEGYLENQFVYSKNKWTKLLRIIRHKTDKKIYKVVTRKGIVYVTEDHSLINANGKYIKPQECEEEKTSLFHKKIDI